jgi:hypothetical protein
MAVARNHCDLQLQNDEPELLLERVSASLPVSSRTGLSRGYLMHAITYRQSGVGEGGEGHGRAFGGRGWDGPKTDKVYCAEKILFGGLRELKEKPECTGRQASEQGTSR